MAGADKVRTDGQSSDTEPTTTQATSRSHRQQQLPEEFCSVISVTFEPEPKSKSEASSQSCLATSVPSSQCCDLLQPQAQQSNVCAATAIRRKRGPSLSRRIGQDGSVFQRGFPKQWNPAVTAFGRYWIDVPGGDRKRRTVPLGTCPSRSIAKKKLREHIEREGINSKEYFNQNARPAVMFGEQAARWLAQMATRRRKPVRPATLARWRYSLDNWLLPNLADKPLSDVSNRALRDLIGMLTNAGQSPASIIGHVQVVKMVVASAVDEEGEQLYPRKWNHEFIELPIVRKENQHRPTVTGLEIEQALANTKRRYAVLFALLAGSGLRIGEALALKTSDLTPEYRVLHVRHSIWGGREQEPKTPNAIREVDLAEPLARLLQEHVSGRAGYVFATTKGTAFGQRNALRALHATGKKIGFHAFRRFRTEVLRRARVPEDLVKLWLGHSKQSVTDFYADGLRNDTAWRLEWCERAGLGFSLDGLLGLQKVVRIGGEKVA
jgi:integrase